jgi:hypothetical protein
MALPGSTVATGVFVGVGDGVGVNVSVGVRVGGGGTVGVAVGGAKVAVAVGCTKVAVGVGTGVEVGGGGGGGGGGGSFVGLGRVGRAAGAAALSGPAFAGVVARQRPNNVSAIRQIATQTARHLKTLTENTPRSYSTPYQQIP